MVLLVEIKQRRCLVPSRRNGSLFKLPESNRHCDTIYRIRNRARATLVGQYLLMSQEAVVRRPVSKEHLLFVQLLSKTTHW